MRFKVGDKVRMTGKGCSWFCSDISILDGREATVMSVDEYPMASTCPYYVSVESFGSYYVSPDAIEPAEPQAETRPRFRFGDKVRVSHDWFNSGAGEENEAECYGKVGVVLDARCSDGTYEVAFPNGDSWYIESGFLEPACDAVRSCPADACCSRAPQSPPGKHQEPEAEVLSNPLYSGKEGLSVASTGAVRSKDADNVRYDLITPIGLRVVRSEACGWSYLVVMRKKQLSPCRLADEARSNLYESLSGLSSDEFKKRLSHAFMELAWSDKMARSGFDADDVIAHLDDVRNAEIPSTAYEAVARACHEGATKYGDWNWERGFSVGSLLNHALKHISDWLGGDNTEDHLGHAMWNVLAAIHSYILWPHLNEGQLRGPGCTPPRKEVMA